MHCSPPKAMTTVDLTSPAASRSRTRATMLCALACALPPFVSAILSQLDVMLLASSLLAPALAAFCLTDRLVPAVCARTLKRGLFGFDLNKPKPPSDNTVKAQKARIPEAAGLAAGAAFLLCSAATVLGHGPLERLAEFHAGLLCIAVILLAGFADDMLDLPWRVKLALPVLAAIPLLSAYQGPTTVVVPKLLRPMLLPDNTEGISLDLGIAYKVYMLLMAVFCSNAINIHAGINGLEVGQTAFVASGVLALNFQSLSSSPSHAYSARLVAPLLGCCLGMLKHNAYPAAVFPGDTFTFFAGMSLAVAGILGHFTEALLVLMLPQLLNFLLSLPQLFGLVHCPRHRVPTLTGNNKLESSGNFTVLNVILRLGGARSEGTLCTLALSLQFLSIGVVFLLRYMLAGIYK